MMLSKLHSRAAHAIGLQHRHYRATSGLMMLVLAMALAGCHTTRHVVTKVDEKSDSHSVHQEQAALQRFDSLFSRLSVSADSITILLYDNAGAYATPCGSTSPASYGVADATLCASGSDSLQGFASGIPLGKTSSVKGRITIHSPRISKEERAGSATSAHSMAADSTRSNTEAHTSTDSSKEVTGGAEPPKLTWVFIVLGLGITLLIIGAVFVWLWLRKKGIV